jgi:hypothetical protein
MLKSETAFLQLDYKFQLIHFPCISTKTEVKKKVKDININLLTVINE